jgi:carbon storage regulator
MLVLSRKSQESVMVGRSGASEPLLKVTVLEIKSDRVRLGFEADSTIPVHRWEVWERIRAGVQPESPGEDPAPQAVG